MRFKPGWRKNSKLKTGWTSGIKLDLCWRSLVPKEIVSSNRNQRISMQYQKKMQLLKEEVSFRFAEKKTIDQFRIFEILFFSEDKFVDF